MADTVRAMSAFLDPSTGLFRNGAGIAAQHERDLIVSLNDFGKTVCGRLTLESGTPNKIGDVTGASTIYLAPWRGDTVTIWSGSLWVPYKFTQLSRSLASLTSGKNYDVFAYLSSGAVAIDLAPAWTNDTTRDKAVSLKDGIWVNDVSFTAVRSGDSVGQYQGTLLGTIRTTGTSTTEDSAVRRFVSNLWHPLRRHFYRLDTTSHTYSVNSPVRGWNNQSTHTLEWVTCIAQNSVLLNFQGAFTSSGAGTQGARLGMGTSTTSQSLVMDFNSTAILGDGFPMSVSATAGYTIYYVTELATGSGNSTYYYYSLGGEVWN